MGGDGLNSEDSRFDCFVFFFRQGQRVWSGLFSALSELTQTVKAFIIRIDLFVEPV